MTEFLCSMRAWILPWLLLSLVPAPGEVVLFDGESVKHRPTEVEKDQKRVPIGTVELVPGKVGQAVQFSFAGSLGPGFMTAGVAGGDEWSRAEGFSFWVKGDGSTNWGGLELIDRSDYSLRYGFCFPINCQAWKQVFVRWNDLVPELAGPLIAKSGGYSPAGFGNFWFGKWFYWRDYPAISYAIDQVVLETSIQKSSPPSRWGTGLERVREKLKRKQPVAIVTMGDSLTDKRHWANRELLWADELGKELKAKYGSDITLVNPAIGGTTLSQNLVLTPRWLAQCPKPDLVTIWFGGNDWDTGVRGERFREYLAFAVDRLREQTGGNADILLMTTCPGFKRWETTVELDQATKQIEREKKTGLADVAGAFRRAGSAEEALKKSLWAWDNVHLGTNGHQLVVETVLKTLEE